MNTPSHAYEEVVKAAFRNFSGPGMRACTNTPAEPLLIALYHAIWPQGMTADEMHAAVNAFIGIPAPATAPATTGEQR